MIINTQKR